jgi:hypothetical protein
MFFGFLPVRHVGLEIESDNAALIIVENLGGGTKSKPTHGDEHGATVYAWHIAKLPVRLQKLVDVGGSDYHLLMNNCYHARDRMLAVLGGSSEDCDN